MVFVLIAFGWVGYMLSELMSPGVAFSATVNILSTVGLGENPSHSLAGKIVTVILQIGAVSIVAVAVSAMSQASMLGVLKQYLGRYRMDERIDRLVDHYIVVGYSLTGEALARDLTAERRPFVIIERNPEVITRLEEHGLLFVEGNALDEEVLKRAGIERAKGLFAVLSTDSDNLMLVLSARGLNSRIGIVSKSTREDFLTRFKRAGADSAISPQEWAARQMIQGMLRPNLLVLLSILLDPTMSEASLGEIVVPAGSKVVGQTLAESGIRRATDVVILGVVRSSGELVASPGPETILQDKDVLIGYGRQPNLLHLEEILAGSA
jgi:voltage-gated potassium channel